MGLNLQAKLPRRAAQAVPLPTVGRRSGLFSDGTYAVGVVGSRTCPKCRWISSSRCVLDICHSITMWLTTQETSVANCGFHDECMRFVVTPDLRTYAPARPPQPRAHDKGFSNVLDEPERGAFLEGREAAGRGPPRLPGAPERACVRESGLFLALPCKHSHIGAGVWIFSVY